MFGFDYQMSKWSILQPYVHKTLANKQEPTAIQSIEKELPFSTGGVSTPLP